MKVTDRVYALDSTKGNYAYLVLGRETVLIDTGRPGQGKNILHELDTLHIQSQEIKHILLTHHDVDHIGSAAFLQQATHATLWASQEDIPYILGEKPRHGFKKYLNAFFKVETPRDIHPYPADHRLGELEIIPAPGHTPGHVCLLFDNVLFAGDLVTSMSGRLKPSPSIMTWDKPILMESIKNIAPRSFQWVCPAHGTPLERGDQWEKMYAIIPPGEKQP